MSSALELFRMSSASLIAEGSGSGWFSSVYKTSFPNMVVKKGRKASEDGWLAYACMVIALGDKKPTWMPDIHAIKINWEENTFEALMGKLTPLTEEDGNIHQCYSFSQFSYYDKEYNIQPRSLNNTARFIFKQLFELDAENGGQVAAMGMHFDGHKANWMMRDGVLVLNDPFCSPDFQDLLHSYVRVHAACYPDKIIIEEDEE